MHTWPPAGVHHQHSNQQSCNTYNHVGKLKSLACEGNRVTVVLYRGAMHSHITLAEQFGIGRALLSHGVRICT